MQKNKDNIFHIYRSSPKESGYHSCPIHILQAVIVSLLEVFPGGRTAPPPDRPMSSELLTLQEDGDWMDTGFYNNGRLTVLQVLVTKSNLH